MSFLYIQSFLNNENTNYNAFKYSLLIRFIPNENALLIKFIPNENEIMDPNKNGFLINNTTLTNLKLHHWTLDSRLTNAMF